MGYQLIDLGNQDGIRCNSPQEMIDLGRTFLTAGKALPAKTGAVVIGLGEGVRIEIGPGAGKGLRAYLSPTSAG